MREGGGSPVDPTLELLDRQVEFLLKQPDDASFLVQIGPFLRALNDDDRLASYLEDISDELLRVVQVLEVADAELVPELVELRDELIKIRPEADDSGYERPDGTRGADKLMANLAYQQTLAYFDALAFGEPEPFDARGKGGKAVSLLAVLQTKDQEYLRAQEEAAQKNDDGGSSKEQIAPEEHASAELDVDGADADSRQEPTRTDLDRWRTRVGNVDRRLSHARRWYRLRVRTSGGVALLKLEAARDAMQPPLKLMDVEQGLASVLDDALKLVGSADYSLLKLADEERLSDGDMRIIAERVVDLRTSTERLHEELRRRVSVTRSRLALVHRFKLRCEWHDRDRISAVADNESLSGGPEDRLTAEFARYLFDQGLAPLSKPMTGGLQPDLLDPSARFYVEAKQYKSSARGDIVTAVAQVMDTVGRLRGGQYEVDEAFCVVFRRSGPYYDLPVELRTHKYRVHLVLVDVAPADEAGTRQREKPSVIEPAEFFAAVAELEQQQDSAATDAAIADGQNLSQASATK
jgi:hypothetical protein